MSRSANDGALHLLRSRKLPPAIEAPGRPSSSDGSAIAASAPAPPVRRKRDMINPLKRWRTTDGDDSTVSHHADHAALPLASLVTATVSSAIPVAVAPITSSPSIPEVAAPISSASETSDPQLTIRPTASLWKSAFDTLSAKDREVLKTVGGDAASPDDVIKETKVKRAICIEKQWAFELGDKKIILRDVADKIIQWIDRFKTVGDVICQYDPVHAALPWAAFRFLLQIAVDSSKNMSAVLIGIESIAQCLARCRIYENLYLGPQTCRLIADVAGILERSLIRLYGSILEYLAQANRTFIENTAVRMAFSIFRSPKFADLMGAIDSQKLGVSNDAQVAEARCRGLDHERLVDQAKIEHKRLRSMLSDLEEPVERIDRTVMSINERTQGIDSFLHRSQLGSEEAYHRALLADKRQSRERKERLIKALSPYDYRMAFNQARRKYYDTGNSWLSQKREFQDWKDDTQSSVFWCHGIREYLIAKASPSARIIDELSSTNLPAVGFFFCQYDSSESLKARVILGSLTRQCLNPDTMSVETEALLKRFSDFTPDVEELRDLLEDTLAELQLIVIDAIDECEKAERNMLFLALGRLMSSPRTRLKIFLTSGLHIGAELKRSLKVSRSISMNSPEADSVIKGYIESAIAKKVNDGELVVGQPQLLADIQKALVDGAKGMFLWVTFQIQDICDQMCDADIRMVIVDLPKNLTETYERVLRKIKRAGTAEIAEKIFRWVAAAKRPLYLDELREAISVKPCQLSRKPEDTVNDVDRLVPCCGNLIVLDAEKLVVQFAHYTVKQFLLMESKTPSLDSFHFRLSDADYNAGEVCVTYLNFNDFKRQVAKTTPLYTNLLDQTAVLKASLSAGLGVTIPDRWLRWARSRKVRRIREFDIERQLYDASGVGGAEMLQRACAHYALLPYASEHWLSHSSSFTENTKTWRLWSNLLLAENSFAQTPWTLADWTRCTRSVIRWVLENDHSALLRHIESSSTNALPSKERREFLIGSAALGRLQLVDISIDLGKIRNRDLEIALQAAAGSGHLNVVERLLAAKVDINAAAVDSSLTALQAAAGGGHLDVVERLLAAEADVNAAAGSYSGLTALQAAAGGGHLDVVERLLAAEADANAAAGSYSGLTALQAAAGGGHLDVVERLLAAEADVNAAAGGYSGRTALQAAAGGGHLEVVERLLAVEADVNAAAGFDNGLTALQAAAGGGHLDVVERLLAAEADINANASGCGGRTTLQAAAGGGHLDVVERLLTAEADVNAAAGGYSGRTALQAAAGGGHLEVVERLLAAGADVNAAAGFDNGLTALQAAAGGGHLDVVERLLAAEADINANASGCGGRTALQAAAGGGHLDVVERLLAAEADVNAAAGSYSGRTALQAAAGGGHLEVVERLLAAEADVNAAAGSYSGRTALQAAAGGGHLDVVERLLAAEADVNAAAGFDNGRTALQAAAGGGHLDVVERLLVAEAGVNAAAFGYSSRTALQAAAGGGHLDVVERLLAAEADVNTAASFINGRTALQAAAGGGHLDVVERLLAAEADVNAVAGDYSGRTALQAAAGGGHLDVVERLLAAGADVNATAGNYPGRTALRAAAGGGHLDVVERLLAAEADVNTADDRFPGQAASQAAMENGHLDVVERLGQIGTRYSTHIAHPLTRHQL